jgi:hypothetical protein
VRRRGQQRRLARLRAAARQARHCHRGPRPRRRRSAGAAGGARACGETHGRRRRRRPVRGVGASFVVSCAVSEVERKGVNWGRIGANWGRIGGELG